MRCYSEIDSPIGRLYLYATGEALCGLYMGTPPKMPVREGFELQAHQPVLRESARQLRQYFDGARRRFELPLHLEGTDFQRRVWRALTEIPFGATWSYAQLARHIGSPTGFRAVGLANGRNPIAVIVPCHRVIGADGSLTGFGGGLPRKEWLLTHEGSCRPVPALSQRELQFGASP